MEFTRLGTSIHFPVDKWHHKSSFHFSKGPQLSLSIHPTVSPRLLLLQPGHHSSEAIKQNQAVPPSSNSAWPSPKGARVSAPGDKPAGKTEQCSGQKKEHEYSNKARGTESHSPQKDCFLPLQKGSQPASQSAVWLLLTPSSNQADLQCQRLLRFKNGEWGALLVAFACPNSFSQGLSALSTPSWVTP